LEKAIWSEWEKESGRQTDSEKAKEKPSESVKASGRQKDSEKAKAELAAQ
jgi:hypothetical protein